jgi:hypothetical protein
MQERNARIILAVVLAAAFLTLAVLDRRLTPQGEWRCENGAWRRVGSPKGMPPEKGCQAAKEEKPAVIDCAALITKDTKADAPYWKQTGHLGRGGSCMKADTWYLRYTTPNGERQMEISFAKEADCRVDEVVADCARMNPPSGSKTVLDGVPDGALFRVTKLQFRTK